MFGKKKVSPPSPKLSKQHQEIRKEVIESREILLEEIAKLERKFEITRAKRNP